MIKKTTNKAKKATPKKATPKKATPKKATPKKATPKKATPKKATPKKATPKKACFKMPPIDDLRKIIAEQYGIITSIAMVCEVVPNTVYKWLDRFPQLKDDLYLARGSIIDIAESALIKNVKAGKETSIIFLLKCLGKDRGWVDKQSIDVNTTITPLNIEVNNINDKKLLIDFDPEKQELNENNEDL